LAIKIDRTALLAWYDTSKRDLPWRLTTDPYAIWVSEIMLQQTQVATVIPYFGAWMARFPTVEALAAADEQADLSVWQGLGYYRRCRMLLMGARWVSEHGVPRSASEWIKVPGIGRYTAAAIASISAGEHVAVVDGNVERVFARFTGGEESAGVLTRMSLVWAQSQIPPDRPGDWNQALMELGATICKPRDPICGTCPVAGHCVANRSGRQSELPVRAKKRATIALRRSAYIYVDQGLFGLEQIPKDEWWHGMWRFPDCGPDDALGIGTIKHVVTHHRISMDLFLVRDCERPTGLQWFTADELTGLPMPAPQRRAYHQAEKVLTRFQAT
jgi:A/G-specific adenine glycosylase